MCLTVEPGIYFIDTVSIYHICSGKGQHTVYIYDSRLGLALFLIIFAEYMKNYLKC